VKLYIKNLSIFCICILLLVLGFLANGKRKRAEIKASAAAETGRLTVVIDAGHGGADGGAVSRDGTIESEVNIDIATRLDYILAFFGTPTLMTRTSEHLEYSEDADTIRKKKKEDQERRLQLVNGIGNAVLISIHQNFYPAAGPFGAQVLYAPTNGSKAFAESMQKLLIAALNTKNRRSAAKVQKSVWLMNHVSCPAILIECGFLSNPEEERLLMTDTYRLKIAAAIAAGYLAHESSLTEIYYGGANEGENSVFLY